MPPSLPGPDALRWLAYASDQEIRDELDDHPPWWLMDWERVPFMESLASAAGDAWYALFPLVPIHSSRCEEGRFGVVILHEEKHGHLQTSEDENDKETLNRISDQVDRFLVGNLGERIASCRDCIEIASHRFEGDSWAHATVYAFLRKTLGVPIPPGCWLTGGWDHESCKIRPPGKVEQKKLLVQKYGVDGAELRCPEGHMGLAEITMDLCREFGGGGDGAIGFVLDRVARDLDGVDATSDWESRYEDLGNQWSGNDHVQILLHQKASHRLSVDGRLDDARIPWESAEKIIEAIKREDRPDIGMTEEFMVSRAERKGWLEISLGRWDRDEEVFGEIDRLIGWYRAAPWRTRRQKQIIARLLITKAHFLEYKGRWNQSEGLDAALDLLDEVSELLPGEENVNGRRVGIIDSKCRLGERCSVPSHITVDCILPDRKIRNGYVPANWLQLHRLLGSKIPAGRLAEIRERVSVLAEKRIKYDRSIYDIDLFHEQVLMAESPISEQLRIESIRQLSSSTCFTGDLNPNSPLRVVACRFRWVIEQAGGRPPELPGPPESPELLEMYECFREDPGQAWARCFY